MLAHIVLPHLVKDATTIAVIRAGTSSRGSSMLTTLGDLLADPLPAGDLVLYAAQGGTARDTHLLASLPARA